jgi:hypothetical protein
MMTFKLDARMDRALQSEAADGLFSCRDLIENFGLNAFDFDLVSTAVIPTPRRVANRSPRWISRWL